MIAPTLFGEQLARMPRATMNMAREYKVIALREQPLPIEMAMCDTPARCSEYWQTVIASDQRFNNDVENFAVLILNARRRIIGHVIVSQGILDTILVHPREVFRAAIVANAAAIVIMHNHPSGDATPSESDIRVTRELINAGKVIKIEVLDHVVVGRGEHRSLLELGYFYR